MTCCCNASAIEKLEALKKEYEEARDAAYEPLEYYRDLKSKIAAIEEALSRLRG